jgi:hypothetical protein
MTIFSRIADFFRAWNQATAVPKHLDGPFGKAWIADLDALPEEDREEWMNLAHFCAQAEGKSKPTGKWLAAAKTMIERFDRVELSDRISRTMADLTPDPSKQDPSLDIVKGLVWLTPLLGSPDLAARVGRFAEKCFQKVPNKGARSVRLANAALWALSDMDDNPRAAAELFRLGEKIKYPSARNTIETRLGELAQKMGQSVEVLEDRSLPDFGLDASSMTRVSFEDACAELAVLPTDTITRWFNGAGKPVKSVPAEVRDGHGAALAAFRRMEKDIEAARAAQVMRLEQAWVEGRHWALREWKRHFLNHPLRRPIVSSLLWRVDGRVLLPVDDQLVDVHGAPQAVSESAHVTLWHPLDSQPEEVLAWRQHILELGLTQPFKQAHREIYVITDAERQTRTYSNRFAAHILRQHPFRALCQGRGWKYNILGVWDGDDIPTKRLRKQGMSVQYLVDGIRDDEESEAGVLLYLTSDQVRFLDSRQEAIELETISPILFSEVMRDVDLFVAVTSVAYDPAWADGGPDGIHGQYWGDWTFGELSQTAATRRDLIAALVPKLSIADKLEVTDKFLLVQGRKHKYAIHFGSSNIQIMPENRYLCIVPTRAPAEAEALKLPFAGDGLLSTILAKAFLLVDESKIRDKVILNQL